MRILVVISFAVIACFGTNRIIQDPIPSDWQRIDAGGYFAFYLPPSMQLRSRKQCEECAWGGTYADAHISLHATYTSWNEGYSAEYLTKQPEYQRQITEIGGKKATIQSWQTPNSTNGFLYIAEARFFVGNGRLVARLSAFCKSQRDLETAKHIFTTVGSFKS